MITKEQVMDERLQAIAQAALKALCKVQYEVDENGENWEIGEAFNCLFREIMNEDGWEQKISTDLKFDIADALANYGAMQWCTLDSCRLMVEQAVKEGAGGYAEELLRNIRRLAGKE